MKELKSKIKELDPYNLHMSFIIWNRHKGISYRSGWQADRDPILKKIHQSNIDLGMIEEFDRWFKSYVKDSLRSPRISQENPSLIDLNIQLDISYWASLYGTHQNKII